MDEWDLPSASGTLWLRPRQEQGEVLIRDGLDVSG